jgi:heat shock protein 4
MSVVGIDFGNTNAVIAAAGRGGVDVVLNGNSNRLNPCMVGFGESRAMGEAAGVKATSNYKNTIKNMKLLVGLAFDDPRAQAEMKRVPFKCVPLKRAGGGPDSIGVSVNNNSEDVIISIEAVAGMMIKHMGTIAASKDADGKTGLPSDWVITIPGYYTDAQRRALLVGCEISGIKGVLRLMHENTATALAYGIFKDIRKEFTKDSPTNVMFIDMGASSYSASVVSFEPGKLIVKSAQYDSDFGGRDFDQIIAEWISAKFEEKYKGKLSGKPMERPKVMLKLLAAAEKAKKTLSPAGVKEARIAIECLMDDYDFSAVLKAGEYETLCAPIIARLNAPIERALAEAKVKSSDLASVEIVGGSTRVGFVKRTFAGILGLDVEATNNGLSTTMNADEAIARGAALQSAILSPRFKVLPYEIIEYNPFPVKIAWDGEATSGQQEGVEVEGDAEGSDMPTNSVVMFDRGSNFPCVRRVTLRRSGEFLVTASYDDSASQYNFPEGVSRDIVTFKVKAPEGKENKVRVNVKQDIHGSVLLSSAQLVEEIVEEEPVKTEGDAEGKEEEKVEKKKKIKKTLMEYSESRPIDWTKAEIDKEFEAEVAMTNADRIVRETSDMRNELESYIYDMRDKIISERELANYCTEEEKMAFSTALETAENWLYEDGFDAKKSVYSEKLSGLKKMGNPIEFRQSEAAGRSNAIAVLKRTVEKYTSWLNSSEGEEQYSHLTHDEFSKCHEKCDEVSSWMYDMMDKQGSVPMNGNPVVTVAEFNAKAQELTNTVSPIMHKPKPKPKPKPEEKKEETKKEAGNNDEGAKEEKASAEEPVPMETEEKPAQSEPEPMDTK